jgi:hypothetical protein
MPRESPVAGPGLLAIKEGDGGVARSGLAIRLILFVFLCGSFIRSSQSQPGLP